MAASFDLSVIAELLGHHVLAVPDPQPVAVDRGILARPLAVDDHVGGRQQAGHHR